MKVEDFIYQEALKISDNRDFVEGFKAGASWADDNNMRCSQLEVSSFGWIDINEERPKPNTRCQVLFKDINGIYAMKVLRYIQPDGYNCGWFDSSSPIEGIVCWKEAQDLPNFRIK